MPTPLKILSTQFIAGEWARIVVADSAHDHNILESFTNVTLSYTPTGGTAIPWLVTSIEPVYGHKCPGDGRPGNNGKVVALVLITKPVGPVVVNPAPFFRRLLALFRPRASRVFIGSGDLGGSATSPLTPTSAQINSTPVLLATE